MTPPAPPIFTAGQIADALCRLPQTVRRELEPIPGQTTLAENGRAAQAWPIERLPASMQTALETASRDKGYRNALHLLARPADTWQPRISISEVAPAWREKAAKLRAALVPALARLDDPALARHSEATAAESEKLALEEYRKEFGHDISARHCRRLFHWTLERDAGARAWHRLEIYLDENAARPPRPVQAAGISKELFQPLTDQIEALENRTAPTLDDRAFLFDSAFELAESLQGQCADGSQRRQVKKALVKFLFESIPALSKNSRTLRHLFDIKFRAWQEGGRNREAIRDARSMKSGNFRRPDFAEDEKKIRDLAILHNGSESLAYRLLRQRGQLSPEFVQYYDFDPRRRKSYVPAAVRANITPDVEMCGPLHRGPWQAKMRGPYIPRDWSDVAPADWFSADDITFNSYFYHFDDAGNLLIERGECLVMIDLRTGYVLDYLLIGRQENARASYSARHIRKLILRVHDKHGLPRKGFYFEQGVWKARMIEELDSKHSLHWRETDCGLKEQGIGLTVHHATTPRAKTIESLIRIWQERQRNEPGFTGFGERTEDFERVQDKLARARRRTLDPATFLYTMEQWGERLNATFEEFNADPQNGKMLQGSSPAEAWRAGVENNPLRKLPDNARYLLASHCKRVTVRQEGIILTIGGERLAYYNKQTGGLIGREVLAYYHVDFPELLTVSDLNLQNPFTVKRLLLPAMSATKEQLQAAHEAIGGHRRAAKVIYGGIRHPIISTITRDTEQDADTAALGEFHNRELAEFETERDASTRKLRKIQRTAAAAGIAAPRNVRNPDRVQEGLEREREIMQRLARRGSAAPALAADEIAGSFDSETDPRPAPGSLVEIDGRKTYILDAAPAAAPRPAMYWAFWKKVEQLPAHPDRHALTQKAIGHHPKPQDMTPAELQKMIDVFSAVLRDSAKQPAPQTP